MDSLSATAGTASRALLGADECILPTSSLLQGVPKDVDDPRTRILNIQESIILSVQEFDTYGHIWTTYSC